MNMSITNQKAFTKSGRATKIISIFVLLLTTATLAAGLQQQQQQQQEEHALSAEDNVRRSVVDNSKTNYAAMADSILSIDADTNDPLDDDDGGGGGGAEVEGEEERAPSIFDLSNSSDMDIDETVAPPLNVGVKGAVRIRGGGSVAGNAVTNKPINGNYKELVSSSKIDSTDRFKKVYQQHIFQKTK